MTNIAIFVSGNGTNCENIIRHFSGNGKARVGLVVSNRPDAYALVRAAKYGVPCKTLARAEINDPGVVLPLLAEYGIGFIVLAGFMQMIPGFIIARFGRRIINVHPSLLPKFGGKGMYGRHVHEAVKEAEEKETGITIHFVSDVCDGGEIIAQFKVAVSPGDTVDDIERKVHALEKEHFPDIIEKTVSPEK